MEISLTQKSETSGGTKKRATVARLFAILWHGAKQVLCASWLKDEDGGAPKTCPAVTCFFLVCHSFDLIMRKAPDVERIAEGGQ